MRERKGQRRLTEEINRRGDKVYNRREEKIKKNEKESTEKVNRGKEAERQRKFTIEGKIRADRDCKGGEKKGQRKLRGEGKRTSGYLVIYFVLKNNTLLRNH